MSAIDTVCSHDVELCVKVKNHKLGMTISASSLLPDVQVRQFNAPPNDIDKQIECIPTSQVPLFFLLHALLLLSIEAVLGWVSGYSSVVIRLSSANKALVNSLETRIT